MEFNFTTLQKHKLPITLTTLTTSTNKLLPLFLGVRNGNEDHIETVIAGNERVLGARLADAVYFFNKDKEIPLKEKVKDLDRLVFQKDLGTYVVLVPVSPSMEAEDFSRQLAKYKSNWKKIRG